MMNGSGHGPGPHSRVIDRVMNRVNDACLEKALAVCEDLFEDTIDQLNDSPTSADSTTRSFSHQKIGCAERFCMYVSHPLVHPEEAPPTTKATAQNALRVRIKDVQGMPGTLSGLALHLCHHNSHNPFAFLGSDGLRPSRNDVVETTNICLLPPYFSVQKMEISGFRGILGPVFKGRWLASHKNVRKYRKSVIVPSMFPSEKSFTEQMDANDSMEVGEKHENGGNVEDALQSTDDHATVANEQEEEVSDFPLECCMRIVPHDQNGGAFFIAVFHKHSALPGAKQQFLEAFINK
ncbi:hypothetical protein ACFX1T_021368 [Malus domestica]